MKAMALALQAICLVSYCSAQNLVPNASFEQGTNEPTGWTHSVAGVMNWETFGRTGQRSISVSGTGGCGTEWRTPCDYKPGKVYMVRTWAMATNATPVRRGYASLGYVVNRYFTPTDDWAEYSYVGVVPNDATASVVRVGHCPLDGTLLFDDVEVRPVFPVHTRDGDYQLGSGEAFRDGHYTFQTQLNRKDGNYSRCLHEHTSRYDTDRWSMATNTWVTYRHSFSPSVFTNARIKATLNWSANSKLVAEVSTNGVEWTETGSAEPLTSGYVITLLQTNLPSHLFPTDQLFVRLRATGDLWLKEYAFEADLPGGPAFMDGRTGFLEQQVPGATVQPLWFSETPAGYALTVELRNPGETDHQLITTCVANGPTGSRDWSLQTTLPSQSTNVVDFILPTAGAGENTVAIQITDTTLNEVLFQGSIPLTVAAMRDSSYGARLTDSPECATWWCEPTYKVNRDRLPPPASWAPGTNGPPSVEISAARNEYEPFQIVLRPTAPLHDVQISVADFSLDEEPGSPGISATNVEICLVDYVPVTQPSDYTGTTGDHPDPLIPVTSSLELAAGQNHPLWITVFVPKETPPGEYQSQITIQSTSSTITVPVRLRVYNFGLSDVTHTRTAFNVRLDSNWYPSTTLEQRRALWDKYMQNFRKHRITPYAAQFMDPLKWSYNGQKFTFDFAAFDTSLTRYLDEFDFNGFNLMELPWNLGGHPRFSPEYRRLLAQLLQPIVAHVREKGWFDKAFCYWYDEPPESDYPFVAEGMKAIQECAPGLKRFITVHPVPALYNHVDIWVPWFSTVDSVTDRFRLRQAVGDEMWWYVCTGPKAPWPNNFVDHPAINHRIRPWLGEKYGIKGELYWQTTWYLGTSNLLHNPWTNAMSMQYMGWAMGNGDGVMLYPAAKQPPADITTLDFYNSQRWELTRESLEDGEYFWWLKQALQRAQARLGHNHPAVQEGHAAYQAVLKVTISAKDFERNPSKLHALRHRIGLAIESLNDGTPFFAKQPASQSALAGETVVLRAEALGWPLPQFQWQLDGIDVPNATNASLTLTQVTEAQAGSYTVRSVNQNGTALSSKAQLAVVVPAGQAHLPPRLLEQPSDRAAQPGGNAVFAVTAISTTPMAYQWHCNGIPLPQGTNSALLLTNLSSAHLGSYSVTISNPAGSISTPGAALRFFSPQLSATAASNGVLLHLPPSNLPGKVQVSTNLSNWSDLIYHFPGTEPVTVLDPETATKPSRFYRLQLEQ